jgi:hypothetical protein
MKRLLALGLALAAFAAADQAAARRTALEPAHVGYPSSIASVGDSSSTGYNADSAKPPHDELSNSWSTGDNPVVQSHYLRILAHNPRIKAQVANVGKDGAPLSDLIRQVGRLASFRPDYLIFGESFTPDFCNGHDDIAQFSAGWMAALRTASLTVPNARIFVEGPWFGAPSLVAGKGTPESRAAYSDGTLCDPQYDASGEPNPDRIAFVDQKLRQYNTLIAAACARFIHCRFDGGMTTFGPVLLEDISSDFGHASVQGIAKAATETWSATFDFTDATAPVSRGRVAAGKAVLTATDKAGVAGIEYKLGGKGAWIRYAKPVPLTKGQTLIWRAVDLNGNSEATHTLQRR